MSHPKMEFINVGATLPHLTPSSSWAQPLDAWQMPTVLTQTTPACKAQMQDSTPRNVFAISDL